MSTPTPAWRVVAEREITTRLRDKVFLGSLAFALGLLVVVFVVTTFLDNRTTSYDVAVTDSATATATVSAARDAVRQDGDRLHVERAGSATEAERLVRDGKVDAAVVARDGGVQLVGDQKIDDDLESALRSAVSGTVLERNAADRGIDLSALQAGTRADVRLLDPGPEDEAARSLVAVAFAVIFLLTAASFGMVIAQSVVQEKESRIVEILAAAVPIRALLWGKVLGNSVMALLQVVLMSVVGVVGLAVTGRGELLSGLGPAVAWYVALFALGFVSLASLWSVAGAVAGRQQDLQGTTVPGQLLLFVPYFVTIFAGDQVKTVFSMLPIVSTMTMPGRIAEGHVPGWQIAVAILTTVAAAVVFIRVGERLYERSLLHTGGKLSYREAFARSA